MTKIAELLKERDMSPTELGFESRVHPSQISRLLANKAGGPGLKAMRRIAGVLGVPIEDLLDDERHLPARRHSKGGRDE